MSHFLFTMTTGKGLENYQLGLSVCLDEWVGGATWIHTQKSRASTRYILGFAHVRNLKTRRDLLCSIRIFLNKKVSQYIVE